MSIIVTGAAGLIGSELCNQLSNQGNLVIGLDDMSRGTTIPKCSQFINHDLKKDVCINLDEIEIIYHLAAINGTTNFYNRPNEVSSNNSRIDLNVFELAKKCKKLKKFVYASSSEMITQKDICSESNRIEIDDISNPRWSYKISKMLGENYLHNSNLPWIIIRYFNVYGSETKSGHIIHDQIVNHKKGVYKVIGPKETRCYTHVEDAVDATIACINKSKLKETINIGSQEELTSLDVAKIIGDSLGIYPDTYEMIEGRIGSVKRRIPDITKLMNYYPDYNPKSLKEGVKKILL